MNESGLVVFSEVRKNGKDLRPLEIPCGQCIGCRLERSRQWAMRCMHEASLSDLNSFITLTYDDDHLPMRGQLVYEDYQRFMKRLRKAARTKVRFFMCGEYGEETQRPHYHAILFGWDFPDKEPWRKLDSGCKVYTSKMLERLWPFGHSSIGTVTFESAAYVARYCVKKVTGKGAYQAYQRVDEYGEYQLQPEFAHMSLKPGIGAPWLEKFKADVYPHDYVVVNGKETKPPKYYDKLLSVSDAELMEWIKFSRGVEAEKKLDDNSLERLAVKETVAAARLNQFRRVGQ